MKFLMYWTIELQAETVFFYPSDLQSKDIPGNSPDKEFKRIDHFRRCCSFFFYKDKFDIVFQKNIKMETLYVVDFSMTPSYSPTEKTEGKSAWVSRSKGMPTSSGVFISQGTMKRKKDGDKVEYIKEEVISGMSAKLAEEILEQSIEEGDFSIVDLSLHVIQEVK